MARSLTQSVIHAGRVYPAGTSEDAAPGVPDGLWWDQPSGGHAPPVEPPRSGKGSGVEAWRTYADALGITHPDDATRDDIVALVDAEG